VFPNQCSGNQKFSPDTNELLQQKNLITSTSSELKWDLNKQYSMPNTAAGLQFYLLFFYESKFAHSGMPSQRHALTAMCNTSFYNNFLRHLKELGTTSLSYYDNNKVKYVEDIIFAYVVKRTFNNKVIENLIFFTFSLFKIKSVLDQR
jgi:hypothetical protein